MKIYTLKTTKSRSNPQVIREFQIDGRRPVADLLAMLDLLFGSNISQYAVFTQGEQIFHDLSVPIEKVFTKQPLLCTIDDPASPSVLFLDVLDITEEDAFSCPHLLRYRVSNKKEDDYYSSYSDSMEELFPGYHGSGFLLEHRYFFAGNLRRINCSCDPSDDPSVKSSGKKYTSKTSTDKGRCEMAEHGCLLDHDPGFYVPDGIPEF